MEGRKEGGGVCVGRSCTENAISMTTKSMGHYLNSLWCLNLQTRIDFLNDGKTASTDLDISVGVTNARDSAEIYSWNILI